MKASHPQRPLTFGLFEKRIEGDDSLMALAQLRFQQAGMGAEMHAGTLQQLEWALPFRPSADAPVVVHLARDFNLADERSRSGIVEFASRFAGRVWGLIMHDHPDLVSRSEETLRAVRELNSRLQQIERCPLLFIEYAAGLKPDQFAGFFGLIEELTHISACLDIGHVGIWQARSTYAQLHPDEDVFSLKSQGSNLSSLMADVQTAAESALPQVLNLVEALGAPGKPVHFHLHDGHPLSTFSPFGVSDHLSFLAEIPLGCDFRGRRTAPLMFGPPGLSQIVTKAIDVLGPERVSFTLEIHPVARRLALGDAAPLFTHWRDKTNAELMNHWLSLLAQNHRLLLESLNAALDRHESVR